MFPPGLLGSGRLSSTSSISLSNESTFAFFKAPYLIDFILFEALQILLVKWSIFATILYILTLTLNENALGYEEQRLFSVTFQFDFHQNRRESP